MYAKKGIDARHMTQKPLAETLRPQQLTDFVGQTHLIGSEKPLTKLLQSDQIPSLILWGPPGCGKTTLAFLIAKSTKAKFHHLSAVLSGIKDLRSLIESIEKERETLFQNHHILFIDEIHRWNKAQQDALLPYVENGTITLIGATTENPSFEVIGPLLSRCKVYVLESLSQENLKAIASSALQKMQRKIHDDALQFIINSSDGDARRILNTIEIAANLNKEKITLADAEAALQKKSLLYDRKGEEHYNIISAFIKSMRGSDPDAAIYYLARMYEAGEDPKFIARRMVIFASEDIGNANPAALGIAVHAFRAFEIVGQAEGWIPLAQAATYLATSPKSNASYVAYKNAKADVEEHGTLPVPLHLRNAPTSLMKDLGYGKEYQYAHDYKPEEIKHGYLPEKLLGKKYYKKP